jgi:hypothetical protein
MAEGLGLRQETAYDALLLMDRVMSTGTSLTDGLSRLFVAAALRVSLPRPPACPPARSAALPHANLLHPVR